MKYGKSQPWKTSEVVKIRPMRIVVLLPLLSLMILLLTPVRGADTGTEGPAIKVDFHKILHPVQKHIVAVNMEDINFQIYGGFYSQMILGESFQEPAAATGVSGQWGRLDTGSARGRLNVVVPGLYGNRQSQQIEFVQGEGEVGIIKSGPNTNPLLEKWGLSVHAGRTYEGLIRLKAYTRADVYLSFRNADGTRIYDEKVLNFQPDSQTFQRLFFTLKPDTTDNQAQFAIVLRTPAKIDVGYVFVQPGEWGRYKGLPVRKDLAEAILGQGTTLIRYNGSMNYPGTLPGVEPKMQGDGYRWKSMIGPRDERRPYRGYWYRYATHGWGIFDMLDFCEKAGVVPVIGINTTESDQDLEDFAEYVNGPPGSKWGAVRAANGHPAPYNLKYVQVGNETDPAVQQQADEFKRIARALWRKDRTILPVVADWVYFNEISDPNNFTRIASGKGSPPRKMDAIIDILRFFKDNGIEGEKVWWDVHVQVYQPRSAEQLDGGLRGIRTLKVWMTRLAPECGNVQLPVLEENSTTHALKRAIGHARLKNELLRDAGWIPASGTANAMQAWNQYTYGNGFRHYDQGHITFTSDKVFFQPIYYVDQMISRNWSGQLVASEAKSPKNALDVTALRSTDGRSLVVSVVNLEPEALTCSLITAGFHPTKVKMRREVLTGGLEDVNTLQEPEKIRPTITTSTINLGAAQTVMTFPGCSFTVITLTD